LELSRMAPRRVAAALASEDTLEDSIRQDMLNGGDADPVDDPADDPVDDPADDPVDDPADDPVDDPADDPAPRRRAAVREPREPEPLRLSPEAEARIATAERIAAEAQARADAVMQQFGQQRETPEQEAARLATMTPEQIIDYKLGKALGQHNQTIARVTFNAQNSADKASFDSIIASNPQLKRFAPDVERKHADMVRDAARTGAQVPTRNTVLTYMLGERAMELAQKAAPQQRERQRRVERQQARPGSGRSDVSTTRRRETTLEQRLENVQL
jgi:hypothetical protein